MSATSALLQAQGHSDGPTLGTAPAHISCRTKASQTSTIRSIFLPGPAGRLETILNAGSPDAPFAALVCHPHPLFGGNLHNKVVYHTAKALNDPAFGLGLPVLRFNFRGVGLSEGAHDGEAEVDDVLAALEWLSQEFNRPLVLAGFSFGAAMALRACRLYRQSENPAIGSLPVSAMIALGLPTQIETPAYNYQFLNEIAIPKLFLSGEDDPFSPPERLNQVTATAHEPKELILLPGADHFFSGHLEPMQCAIAGWVKEQLR